MIMKKLILVAVVLAVSLGLGSASSAAVLTFDDLPACTGICGSIGSYGGFTWSPDFYYMHTPTYNVADPDDGYNNGTVSGEYVAFNAFAQDVMVTDGLFDFTGAYLTSAWRTGLNITVEGFANNVLLYSTTVVTNHDPAAWFQFDYLGVDKLTFHSFGGVEVPGLQGDGAHFAMDNFTYNETAVPEPATLTLLGFGLAGIGFARRRQQ
jgi:hypothetical protein